MTLSRFIELTAVARAADSTKKIGERYVSVEAPDTSVVVRFLDQPACAVTLTREKIGGRWHVVVIVKQNVGDGHQWTEQTHAFPCPVRKVRR